ncbi:peptidoglycan editing factor PgeF [Alkalicoccus urumqiensis]|uniref:Purine nucleoside phosphorylase n=1 Tax=Alkalicoccus urumqiensis TaxID=1548213 RepID=A0A2P6MEH1_ALKUR|nr:peptidoglycan editing factor PgeF [Alkalicoccus urumqiensis]PRO64689.1 peptidoglycan editing factor PgeF [Alkalicoccus urumqiensis]
MIQKGNTLRIEEWEAAHPGLTAGFTLRSGGVSPEPYDTLNLGYHVHDDPSLVTRNREITAGETGMPLSTWVGAEQTHGDQIVKVQQSFAGLGASSYEDTIKGTDGFYTTEDGLLLTLGYADCIPVYFLSEDGSCCGIVHAGWKGTVKNIAGKLIHLWESAEQMEPGTVRAWIGPGIDSCCYEVDQKVIDQLQEVLPDIAPYEKTGEDTYALNLKEANRQLLIKAGVPPENIGMSTLCTSCEEESFFSHRRDGAHTGRMLGFIGRQK